MNYLTSIYMMVCGKETDNVEEHDNDVNEEKDEKDEGEEDVIGCGCFSSLISRKKIFAYKKNKPLISLNEINKRKQLQKYIRSLPEELKLYILSYTHQPQPPPLLKDIQNFHLTFRFLFNVICKKNPRKIISRILTFYDSSVLYNNITPIIRRKIQRWQINHRNTKIIDDFIIIEYPNILKLFNKNNKHIFLWGILPPFYRNKYLNFLYSVMDIETDEEDTAPPAFDPTNNPDAIPTPTPNTETDTDTNADTDPDANPAPDTDTDPSTDFDTDPNTDFDTEPNTDFDTEPNTDFDTDPDTAPDTDDSPDADTDATPRCSVYFA